MSPQEKRNLRLVALFAFRRSFAEVPDYAEKIFGSLTFVFDDGTSQSITVQDDHKPQTFDLKANDVSKVTIRIAASYGPADKNVAISELEFFKTD